MEGHDELTQGGEDRSETRRACTAAYAMERGVTLLPMLSDAATDLRVGGRESLALLGAESFSVSSLCLSAEDGDVKICL